LKLYIKENENGQLSDFGSFDNSTWFFTSFFLFFNLNISNWDLVITHIQSLIEKNSILNIKLDMKCKLWLYFEIE
jgi:hypothetical protein